MDSTNLAGFVDEVSGTRISGWAADIAHPDRPLEIALHIDGARVATARCSHPRADAVAAGFTGARAFAFDAAPFVTPSTAQLEIVFAATSQRLGNGLVERSESAVPVAAAAPTPDDAAAVVRERWQQCEAILHRIRDNLLAGAQTSSQRAWLDQCTQLAAGCAEHGHPRAAGEMLRAIQNVAPDHVDSAVELLIFNMFIAGDRADTERIIARLSAEQRNDPRLTVLCAEHAYRTDDIPFLLACHYRTEGVALPPSSLFSAMRDKHATQIGLHGHRIMQAFFGEVPDGIKTAIDRHVIARLLRDAADATSLCERLQQYVLLDGLEVADRHAIAVEVMSTLASSDRVEHVAVALHFLVSTRSRAAADALLAVLLPRPDVWSHPLACKALACYLDIDPPASLQAGIESTLERRPWRADGWTFAKARVEALELNARDWVLHGAARGEAPPTRLLPPAPRPAPPAGARPVFVVGLFGQIRHEGLTMPELRRYLESHIEPVCRRHGVELRWAAAVWSTVGERRLAITDGLGFVLDRLPQAIAGLCAAEGIASTQMFGAAFPNLFARLLRAPQDGSPIDCETVEALFGQLDIVDLADEAAFAAEFAQAFPNAPRDWINQGRMWSRINSLHEQVMRWESGSGYRVVGAFLTRPDMIYHYGDWDAAIEPILLGQADTTVHCDNDPLANFVEGIGDRYFVAARAALPRLAGVWDAILDIAPRRTPEAAQWRLRFNAHTLAHSYLFQQATRIVSIPSERVRLSIHRGRMELSRIRPELLADHDRTPPGSLRRALGALLDLAD